MTVTFLWCHRERPALFSRRWFIVWLKRCLTAIALLKLLATRRWLRSRGASIGRLSIFERCRFEGRLGHLSVGTGCFIGEDSYFVLHDRVTLGECVVINRNVVILTASHSIGDPEWKSYHRPVTIESYAWIATGAMLLPGVTIGRGAVVGAGAVVRMDVPALGVVVGNPARQIAHSRTANLDYLPTRLAAPYEAWLGSAIARRRADAT